MIIKKHYLPFLENSNIEYNNIELNYMLYMLITHINYAENIRIEKTNLTSYISYGNLSSYYNKAVDTFTIDNVIDLIQYNPLYCTLNIKLDSNIYTCTINVKYISLILTFNTTILESICTTSILEQNIDIINSIDFIVNYSGLTEIKKFRLIRDSIKQVGNAGISPQELKEMIHSEKEFVIKNLSVIQHPKFIGSVFIIFYFVDDSYIYYIKSDVEKDLLDEMMFTESTFKQHIKLPETKIEKFILKS